MGEFLRHASNELAKIAQVMKWGGLRHRFRQVVLAQECSKPSVVRQMIGDVAEAVALFAVDQVDPSELRAESGRSVVIEIADGGNEINPIDSLQETALFWTA